MEENPEETEEQLVIPCTNPIRVKKKALLEPKVLPCLSVFVVFTAYCIQVFPKNHEGYVLDFELLAYFQPFTMMVVFTLNVKATSAPTVHSPSPT